MLANISESRRVALLTEERPAIIPMVVDTDTFNEVDDQFALSFALLSPRTHVEAVYAAPFFNALSDGPEDGMEKSYEEIFRLLDRLPQVEKPPVFKGSRRYMTADDDIVDSPAARDLVERARAHSPEDPLYVVTLGCPANVASAILMAPDILDRIVVVWLGGQPLSWYTAHEFNLQQDLHAARVLFDSGVALVLIPTETVTDHLTVTVPELDYFLQPSTPIGEYLAGVVRGYHDHFNGGEVWSKVIWDIVAVAWCLAPQDVPSRLVPSPRLQDDITYSLDFRRHLIREVYAVRRDNIFREVYRLLGSPRIAPEEQSTNWIG